MIRVVIRKEWREAVRDGRLRLFGALVVILALTALAFGVQSTNRAQALRDEARSRAAAQWNNQGEKNPHVAAHYGTFVFAPTTAATAIDPGVSAYVGRVVKLEAHQRALANHSSAEDGSGASQFSVATVLYLLVPLLIIALGYGAWSLERERGTLRQVLSTQISRNALFWGKAFALTLIITALLLPAALIVILTLIYTGGADSQTLLRLAILALAVAIYWAAFGGLTLVSSATAASSRTSLIAMVGVWGIFCLVIPRLSTEASVLISPLPSRAELARQVGTSLKHGIDGNTEREVAVESIVRDMMAEQGFEAGGLLVDEGYMAGLELQAEAQWEDSIFDHHLSDLESQIHAQERVVSYAGFLSPFIAMQTLSTALCGTDYFHHQHFTRQAESYRKLMVSELNVAFSELAGVEGWEYKAGPELWSKLPTFSYEPPALMHVLSHHMVSLLALLWWFILAVLAARYSATRVKVV